MGVLSHGVTVALQILVLSVKVRILMAQQEKGEFGLIAGFSFYFHQGLSHTEHQADNLIGIKSKIFCILCEFHNSAKGIL